MNVVPTWGGSMFEALMVPLFVPEEKWGPQSWGVNHPLYVRGQIEHGLDDAQYGYWGFSPSNNPAGGYREYGVDALGMDAGSPDGGGYTSDQQRTLVEPALRGTAATATPARRLRRSTATAWSPRTRPSSPTATPRRPRWPTWPSCARTSTPTAPAASTTPSTSARGQVSKRYLSLDQGMIMAALGNALAGDDMRRYVSKGAMQDKLQPMMRQEVFSAGVR